MKNESSSKSASHHIIGWSVLVVIMALAVGFFIFSEPAISPSEVGESVLPEGVEVVEEGGSMYVIDKKNEVKVDIQKYDVVSPTNIVMYTPKDAGELGEGSTHFSIHKNDLKTNKLEEEYSRWMEVQNNYCDDCWEFVEMQNLDGMEYAVIRDKFALGTAMSILFIKGEYLYDVSLINIDFEKELKNIISDIAFQD